MAGKRPKCENLLGSVEISDVNVVAGMNSWNGISFNCPFCHSILSVDIDPVALKTDTVNAILKGLGRKV